MAICRDFDFPELAAEYRQGGARVMFTPALDFNSDGWWHGRIAITQRMEHGFSLVRTGQWGRITVSDQYGQVLAENSRLAVAELPANGAATFYTRWGDWFAWLSVLLTAFGVAICVTRVRHRGTENPSKTDQ